MQDDMKSDANAAVRVPESRMQATITAFSDAWSRGDVDRLMSLMSDAPLYRTSSGLTFTGRDEVRQGFARLCQPPKSSPPAPAPPGKFVFFDDKCLSYWTLTLPVPGGDSRAVDGIDVITFDPDGRIRIKDAYRKGS